MLRSHPPCSTRVQGQLRLATPSDSEAPARHALEHIDCMTASDDSQSRGRRIRPASRSQLTRARRQAILATPKPSTNFSMSSVV